MSPQEWKSIVTVVMTMASTVMLTAGQNSILTNEAKGPDIVEAVVDEVRQSCVLPQDNLLLRRLAYVESHDGMDVDTFRPNFYGGIWQVTQAMYEQTRTSPYLENFRLAIRAHLSIDWLSTSWMDLRKPLYSGLAAALYVENQLQTRSHPVGVDSQAGFWATEYHVGKQPQTFSSLANIMELGCHGQADLDIAFVMDVSSSISRQDFQHAQQFIINTTAAFDLESGHVRVAVITYSTGAFVKLTWGQATTHSQLNSFVDSLTYESGGTDTDQALDLARTHLFSNARSSALKVVVLVTDGRSHDEIDTAAAATNLSRAVPGILILSVGVGDAVDQDELHNIASDPPCKHTFQVESYGQIDAIRQEIQRLTCRAPLPLYINHTEQCEIGRCPDYVVTVHAGQRFMVKVNTTCSSPFKVFASSTNPYPVASNSEMKVSVNSTTSGIFYIPLSASSFYVNVDQPSALPGCYAYLTALLNEVQVVCLDSGISRPCTPSDVLNYQMVSGQRLCA